MVRWWPLYVWILSLVLMSLWLEQLDPDTGGPPPMLGLNSSHI